MNFFDQQERAKRDTRYLIIAFVFALVAVTAAIDLLVLVIMSFKDQATLSSLMAAENLPIIGVTSLSVLGLIGITSLFRTMSLRAGGGKIATELGGVRVDADDKDPLRRRLRNVVEEIALASGVPVPEIYVLEQEDAINAFAAGYEPSSAAIGVTRGTLEKLNRDELQGVIAHEFSHILNGDMRLNIRLIGLLFGITVISLIGRSILNNSRRTRYHHRSRDDNAAGILAAAFAVMIIGYVGLFIARMIKASLSRKREYLADASAVQFTRDPQGIGGALKKIAIGGAHPKLHVDTEEVSHMMFGSSGLRGLWATHPPIIDRITKIEPTFKAEHLNELSEKMAREVERNQRKQAAKEERERKKGKAKGNMDFTNIVDQIGNPSENQMMFAALIAASIPENLYASAHSTQWAKEVICYTLLDDDPELRQQQLLIVAQRMGGESLEQVEQLLRDSPDIDQQQRLPLAEMTFPALKRRPPAELEEFRETINEIVMVDGRVDVFEYALAKMLDMQIQDSVSPPSILTGGNKSLSRLRKHAASLILVVANLGNDDLQAAAAAAEAGFKEAGVDTRSEGHRESDWRKMLDQSLEQLHDLSPRGKESLIKGLVATITHDHEVTVEEHEVLRIICASIRVPLPMMNSTQHA